MAEKSRLSHYFLIVVFAAAVAALGIRELQIQIPGMSSNGGEKHPNLIQELHGVSTVEKASFSPEAVEKMIDEEQSKEEAGEKERPAIERFFSNFFGK